MNELQAARAQHAAALASMQHISDRVRTDRRVLTPAETAAFATADQDASRLSRDIQRMETAQAADFASTRDSYVDPDLAVAERSLRAAGIAVPGDSWPAVSPSRGSDRAPLQSLAAMQRQPGPSGRTMAAMFPASAHDTGGFSGIGEFLEVLASGRHDSRLRAAVSVGADDPSGGFSMPTAYAAAWLDQALEAEIVRPRATVLPMTARTQKWTSFDADDESASLFGFAGAWSPEATDGTVEVTQLAQLTLTANSLLIYAHASNELIADGLGFDQQLGQALTSATSYLLDEAFLTGTGAGQPEGILTCPATIEIAKETGQTGGTILYSNLLKMFARCAPASRMKAVWVASSECIPQLLALTQPVGTGGSHIPVLSESGGGFRLLTLPIIFSDRVSQLGARGDIGLYDFSQYLIGLRLGLSLERSGHAGFQSNTSYYRAILRADGRSMWKAPRTPRNGGDTVSPFTVLGARA